MSPAASCFIVLSITGMGINAALHCKDGCYCCSESPLPLSVFPENVSRCCTGLLLFRAQVTPADCSNNRCMQKGEASENQRVEGWDRKISGGDGRRRKVAFKRFSGALFSLSLERDDFLGINCSVALVGHVPVCFFLADTARHLLLQHRKQVRELVQLSENQRMLNTSR